MSIKLVPGYDIPQESGLDYQGFAGLGAALTTRRLRGYGDTVRARGHGRVMSLQNFGQMQLEAFYGARLKMNRLYQPLPDPAYGGFGDCGCGCPPPRMSGFGRFGAAASGAGSVTSPTAQPAYYATGPASFSTTQIRTTAGTATGTSTAGTGTASGGSTATDTGAGGGGAAAPAFEFNPMLLVGLGAVGVGLFMLFKKKGA